MKIRTSTAIFLLTGLLLVVFTAVGLAQTQTTQNQKQNKDTMDSCCCAAHMQEANAKTDGQKGCCCCDDSCEMKSENKNIKNHHAVSTGCCCCDGDSCDMTKMDAKADHSAGHTCCCQGDSCDMKEGSQMSHATGTSCCNMKMKHDNMKSEKPKQ